MNGFEQIAIVAVLVVAFISLLYAWLLRGTVLKKDKGSKKMQEVWDAIGRLEARRQDMLVRAAGRGIGLLPPEAGHGQGWADGYRMGFARGYSLGKTSRGQLQSGFMALDGS